MINAIHALVYAKDAEKARAFFRDVLGWPHVDAGRGWLIFALPPAEIAAHPADDDASAGRCEMYLMCDDIHEAVAELRAKGVDLARPIADRGWGIVTAIAIPGGGEMGLYQPRHPIAHSLAPFPHPRAKRPPRKPAKKPVKKSKTRKQPAARTQTARTRRTRS